MQSARRAVREDNEIREMAVDQGVPAKLTQRSGFEPETC
jgi:hypothetical protein